MKLTRVRKQVYKSQEAPETYRIHFVLATKLYEQEQRQGELCPQETGCKSYREL